jgi:hypothetical protein
MQKRKCTLSLYTHFLVANSNRYSGVELSRVAPIEGMAHDAISRWLKETRYTPSELWKHTKSLVDRTTGYVVADDSLLDKRYSRRNELAKKQYSGNAHGLVNGICLINLLWTKGDEYVPVDYRIYQKENDDKTKNDHFQDMLKRAKKRDFAPRYVLMDSWYSSIENMKLITTELTWHFMCNLKSNRKVSVTKGDYVSISDLDLADKQVRKVWLKGYGYVLVCTLVATNGDSTYLATSDLSLTEYHAFTEHFSHRWMIEEFHRGIKQTTGIEQCYSVKAESQKTHIFSAFIAFVTLERSRLSTQVSWYEQKARVSREATKMYLANA